MSEQRERPSIRDVARAANVSIATVSNVYNNKSEMAAATRERVLAAGERLGYRPSAIGRALRHGRSRVLGIVVSFEDSAVWPETYMPYYRDVIAGAALEAVGHGYSIVAAPADADGGIGTDLPLDGVILVDPVQSDLTVDYCLQHGIAVVTDGGYPHSGSSATPLRSVRLNVQDGLPALLNHMGSLGPDPLRPALFVGPRLDSYSTDTIEAYETWCSDQEVEPLVWSLRPGQDPHLAALELFRSHRERFNAVHSLNETYVNAVLGASRQLGIRIGTDVHVSVAGRAGSSAADRRVHYLDVDPGNTGAVCVRTLIDLLEGGAAAPKGDVVLDPAVRPGSLAGEHS